MISTALTIDLTMPLMLQVSQGELSGLKSVCTGGLVQIGVEL